MDNNPLTYVLTTLNLNATGHRWMGMLASYKFTLEYQKGTNNGVAEALNQVPICHNCETVRSLLEGARVGAADRVRWRLEKNPCVTMCTLRMKCVFRQQS